MLGVVVGALMGVCVSCGPLPQASAGVVPAPQPGSMLVLVGKKSNSKLAWRVCKAKYGKRLVAAKYIGKGKVLCTFRKKKKR